jgi:uncharacterized protein (DUF2141 family)
MKHIRKNWILDTGYWILFAGCWLLAAGFSLYNPGGELHITVSNIYPAEGKLYIAIYNNEDDYMDPEKVAFQKIIPINNETESIVIPGVPDGEYAVTVFQDLNNNGELDTSSIGFPREPYGFSNDARGSFGPPKFRKAKFDVNGNTKIRIKLVNDEKEDQ